jgi:hypothetical protein
VLAGLATVGSLPLVAGATSTLLSDDWGLVAAARGLALERLPGLYGGVTSGWYRPSFLVALRVLWPRFGLDALGYHAVAWLLYICMSVMVGVGAWRLFRSRWAAYGATLLFVTMAVHAEPVLWVSAASELAASALALGAFLLVLPGPSTQGGPPDRTPAVANGRAPTRGWIAMLLFLTALTFKETPVFLPIAAVVGTVLLRRRRAAWWPVAGLAVTGAAFLILRVPAGSPYALSLRPSSLVANAAFYGATTAAAIPEPYAYLSEGLWRASPLLPAVCGTLALAGWLLLIVTAARSRDENSKRAWWIPMAVAAAYGLAALAPVVFIVAGRTALSFSVAVVWLGAGLAASGRRAAPRLAAAGIALLVGANILGAAERATWYRDAGTRVAKGVAGLELAAAMAPAGATLCLDDAPEHVRHAYAFRNAAGGLSDLVVGGRPVRLVPEPGGCRTATTPEDNPG